LAIALARKSTNLDKQKAVGFLVFSYFSSWLGLAWLSLAWLGLA